MTASQRATIKRLRENPSRNRFNVQDKQQRAHPKPADQFTMVAFDYEIGRASCRERV